MGLVIELQYILEGGGVYLDVRKCFTVSDIFIPPPLTFHRHTNPCSQYSYISHHRAGSNYCGVCHTRGAAAAKLRAGNLQTQEKDKILCEKTLIMQQLYTLNTTPLADE